MPNKAPLHVKVCGIGDRKCGTSSVIRRLATRTFSERYWPTIGADFTIMEMDICGTPLSFYFWDVNSSPQFQRLRPFYMTNLRSFFITFDLARDETLRHVPQWYGEVMASNPGARGIIIGTKFDRWDESRDTSKDHLDQLSRTLGCKVVLLSCKTGEGCQAALLELVRLHLPLVQSLNDSYLHPRHDRMQSVPLWA